MHEYYTEYMNPKGNPVVEIIKARNPDDVCYQLFQRYGTEYKLQKIEETKESK